jgi:hypothetical protein
MPNETSEKTSESTSPEQKGEQSSESLTPKKIEELRNLIEKEKEGVRQNAQDDREKIQDQLQKGASAELMNSILEALVGNEFTNNEGEIIDSFLQSLDPLEKKYLINALRGTDTDPRRAALHERLATLQESTGEKPKNETVQQIEEFTKGMFEMLPESAKKYEKMIETMVNGLIANIAEAIAEWMKGIGIDNAEAYEVGLAFRRKSVEKDKRKEILKRKEKNEIELSDQKMDEEVKKAGDEYEEGYKKWLTLDHTDEKYKKPPMTLVDAKKLLKSTEKVEAKKEEKVDKKILNNGDQAEAEIDGKKIQIQKNPNEIIATRGAMKVKLKNIDEAILEKKADTDGKISTTLLIETAEGFPERISIEAINKALNENNNSVIETESKRKIPFEIVSSPTT